MPALEALDERRDAVREAEGQVLGEVRAQVVAVEAVQHLEGLLVRHDVGRGRRALVQRQDGVHALCGHTLASYETSLGCLATGAEKRGTKQTSFPFQWTASLNLAFQVIAEQCRYKSHGQEVLLVYVVYTFRKFVNQIHSILLVNL